MKKILTTLPSILFILFLVVGCSNERGLNPVGLDSETPDLDSIQYEAFHQAIDPLAGGLLHATMTTWPEDSIFEIEVPAGALPAHMIDPVVFSVRVPTYESYMAHPDLQLVLRLEPSGIDFEIPVTVRGTYMPWSGLDAEQVQNLGLQTTSPRVESFSHLLNAYEVGSVGSERVRIEFQAPHFSDWQTGQGDSGSDG